MEFMNQLAAYIPVDDREICEKRVLLEYVKQFPNTILTRENEFAHMTSSALILNESHDKVLFIFHKLYNTWTWTGGHSDGEQNLLHTSLREAEEETGLKKLRPLKDQIQSIDIIPVYGHYKNGRYICSHLHLNATYVLIADEQEETKVKLDEASDVKWIPCKKIEKYSNEPYLIQIYQKIIKKVQTDG